MPEQQNIEWKQSWRDEYLQWISGFANSNGGVLYIGKDDIGNVVGVDKYTKLMDELPNKISSKLGVLCDVNLHEENDLYYIEIITKPYNNGISYNGKYYYRSGSTNQELRGNELTEFLLRKTGRTWDSIEEENASFDDINEATVKRFVKSGIASKRLPLETVNLDSKTIFQNLLIMNEGKLTRSAILLFGIQPLRFYVSSFLKIGKFGKSSSELLSQEVVEEGNLFEQLDETLKILFTRFIDSSISYKGIQRIETYEYPYEAVREILLNAFTHRTYENSPIQISVYPDRIMFWNQGELLNPLTPEKLKVDHKSITRNPIIARTFFRAGFVESWGRGTIKIIEECEKAGLLEPKIEELTGGVAITLYKNRTSPEFLSSLFLNERQLKAIEYLKENNQITTGVYQNLFEITDRTALRDLNELIEYRVIKKVGEKKGTKYLLI